MEEGTASNTFQFDKSYDKGLIYFAVSLKN